MHPHLSLVIDCPTSVEIAVTLSGLEGRSGPFVERFGGLNIIVAVAKDRRLVRRMQPVGIDKRMAIGMIRRHGLNKMDVLHTDTAELSGNELSGAANVACMLGQRGDGRYAKQCFQFIHEPSTVLLCKIYRCVLPCHSRSLI